MEKNVTLIALFAALIAALGLIPPVTLGFGVPITAQTLGVMLCGTILGAKRGGLAVMLFLLLVAIGLPLLSGGRGGLGVFAAPSVGFLVGWPIAAFSIGFIVEKWRNAPLMIVAGVASIFGGIIVMYVFGIIGMSIMLEKTLVEATKIAMIYVPGDLLKVGIAAMLTSALATARPASVLSRVDAH